MVSRTFLRKALQHERFRNSLSLALERVDVTKRRPNPADREEHRFYLGERDGHPQYEWSANGNTIGAITVREELLIKPDDLIMLDLPHTTEIAAIGGVAAPRPGGAYLLLYQGAARIDPMLDEEPVPHGVELYTRLRMQGVPSALVSFAYQGLRSHRLLTQGGIDTLGGLKLRNGK